MRLDNAMAFLRGRVDELSRRKALSLEESVELHALRAVLQAAERGGTPQATSRPQLALAP